jgi:alpha-tubulin suppressor-like RCC1 family protein
VPCPLPVNVRKPDDAKIVKIAAGSTHALLVDEAGRLYALGCGRSGQLGRDEPLTCNTAERVTALEGVRVKHASCGIGHSVVTSTTGEVFTFGEGRCGALGHGGATDELVPRRIDSLGRDVAQAVANGLHTIIERKDGEMLVCGSLNPRFKAHSPVRLTPTVETPATTDVLAGFGMSANSWMF